MIDQLGELVADNLKIATFVVSLTAAWLLWGVLGKRYLGADDDFWEWIRKAILLPLDKVADKYGLYTVTHESRRRYAGYVDIDPEEFEVVLDDYLKYFRQPLSSIHINHMGMEEHGSWGRTFSPMFTVARYADKIPAFGGPIGRFLSSLDTILALKQDNLTFYTEEGPDGEHRVHVNHHTEWNPLNPFTAFLHYTKPPTPTPERAYERLKVAGVTLQEP